MISAYLGNVLSVESLTHRVDLICNALLPHLTEFDTIAFRGASGALVAPSVALRLNKKMIMVRKPERSHSQKSCEGDFSGEHYVIIDDMVATGETLSKIVDGIQKMKGTRHINHATGLTTFIDTVPAPVGLVLYEQTKGIEDTHECYRLALPHGFVYGVAPKT